ncbi:hypothetical protein MO867_10000 [Microbulbifer sp. OS29]|uniref:Uncharacterized protein n=1 Tax=Microbulbifer okhotskensis TaxID=2926617 RepID=A0A9X2ELY9_9GAMM|nr:hypothetical protein [Microbulbifer okhotskensis]MCO1334672.1 hypothetical protein [Microbulbifer okhotskensis]
MHNFWLIDILLTLAALLIANQYWRLTNARFQSAALLVVTGLLCIAVSAIIGAYRYGIDPGATQLHRALLRLSGFTALPLIGIGLMWARFEIRVGHNTRGPAYVALVLVLASSIALSESGIVSPQKVTELYSALGLLLWLWVAMLELLSPHRLSTPEPLLLGAGAVLIAIDGLFVGTGAPRVLGLARTNWFHLLLAISLFSLLAARPLFEKGRNSNE